MCNNNSINSDEKSSVLIDKTKSGKIRPWREKKMANVDYFELLHILEFKKAERVKDCAEVLEYKVSYETGEKTLYRVWFCKSRLCPMCNWRRAMKHGIQSQKVVAEVIKQKPTVRWLFLTLTVRNVYDGTELNKSLSDMSKGFNRMMKYKKIGSVAKWNL
nr:protein rep [Staphylococcus sp. GDH8C107P]